MAGPVEMKRAGRRVAAVLDTAADPRSNETPIDARLESIHALRAERRRNQQRNRALGLGAGLACAAAVAFFVLRTPTLTFEVGGSRGELGKWVAAPADAPSTLAFSDGSELELHPAGRARVSGLGKRGATVLLEDGTVTARVVHRDDTDWRITAGPFEVHVVGTTFDAAWSSAEETLAINLQEGRVEVSGSCLESPIAVSTGERVSLTCRGIVVATPPELPTATATTIASIAMPGPSPSQVSSVPTANAIGWRDLAKRGDYKQAIELLEQGGVDSMLSMAPSDLLEVADLARLAGRSDLSKKLYSKLRESHAGSDAAAIAAFQLGRTGGGDGERWLRIYLAERPNGPLAAEALGRILEIEQAAGRPTARATAEEYLSRFPKGAHAAFARKIANP